ncbi:hypothetical protein BpHYR1_043484 [Brachionus plicatilis]|uniref:Uncharacterized protein n=1 Tax=Brachionus plicatilis TaxID=10195 RepID=A0A3M7SU23_BRAPC|nr:hypothetical protein BpHYR1_043484 [Brachionus plicatilis]
MFVNKFCMCVLCRIGQKSLSQSQMPLKKNLNVDVEHLIFRKKLIFVVYEYNSDQTNQIKYYFVYIFCMRYLIKFHSKDKNKKYSHLMNSNEKLKNLFGLIKTLTTKF